MEKRVSSSDLEKKMEEAVMDNGWINVTDMASKYCNKDPAIAIAGDDGPITTDDLLTCEICHISVSGIASFEQHMQGSKHKKKLMKENGPKYLEALKSQELGNETPTEATDSANGDDNVFTCNICNKICTGIVSYKLHIKGKPHQKQVQKLSSIEKLKESPEFSFDDKGSEDSVYDVMPQVKPFAQCDVCNKKFSGPQALQDHLSSGSHKKKLDMENLSKKLVKTGDSTQGESVNPNADSFGGGDCFTQCKICNKSFSGPIPYQQHLISDIHKKKIKSLELVEKMKSLSLDDQEAGTFHCKDCKRSFCIPEQFEQHLNGSSHTNRKTKQEMMKKLQTEYPEMEIQAATADQDESLENDFHLLDDYTVLICSVCHKSFSGPESASAHFVSKKHEKAKKLLLFAEQRKAEN